MNDRLDLQHVCELAARHAAAGATGWAVMINAGPNWFAGCMDPVLAGQVFTPPDSAVAGSGQPGQAEPSPGGGRVAGRWRWCSGAPWATWFTFTAVTPSGDGVAFAVPAGQVRRHDDTWDVRGLRATASWDAELVGVEIPRARSFSLDTPTRVRDEPIFRVPFMTFASATMVAVSVGLARRALAEFTSLARSKRPTHAAGSLADDPVVADAIARTTASVRAADAHWNTAVASLWTACDHGEPSEPKLETDVLLASSHAVAVGAHAGDELWARHVGARCRLDARPGGRRSARREPERRRLRRPLRRRRRRATARVISAERVAHHRRSTRDRHHRLAGADEHRPEPVGHQIAVDDLDLRERRRRVSAGRGSGPSRRARRGRGRRVSAASWTRGPCLCR